jgi:hypothetical protein
MSNKINHQQHSLKQKGIQENDCSCRKSCSIRRKALGQLETSIRLFCDAIPALGQLRTVFRWHIMHYGSSLELAGVLWQQSCRAHKLLIVWALGDMSAAVQCYTGPTVGLQRVQHGSLLLLLLPLPLCPSS